MSFMGPAAGGAILRCVAPRLTVSDSLCAEAHHTNKHQCSMARGACTPLPGAQLPGPACGAVGSVPEKGAKAGRQRAEVAVSPPRHRDGGTNPPPSPLPTSPKQPEDVENTETEVEEGAWPRGEDSKMEE